MDTLKPEVILRSKLDLMGFSSHDLNLLARHYGINTNNTNDRSWLLAISILTGKKYAKMIRADIEFNDYFEEIKVLGEGEYGQVLLVKLKKDYKDLSKDTLVAIKLLNFTEMSGTDLENVQREINILKVVSSQGDCNPHISCYYDVFDTELHGNDYIGIIMEYIPGITLAKYMRKMTIIIDQLPEYMKTLATTLKFLHDKNIVHRDIKPANIMVSQPDNIFKYIDFGFSCFTIPDHEYACKPDIKGSPIYISPERWELAVTEMTVPPERLFELYKKSDVWALGMVFYELLFGILPPEIDDAETFRDLVSVIMLGNLTFINDPEVDPRLVEIIKGMLKKSPNARSTIDEIVDELAKI